MYRTRSRKHRKSPRHVPLRIPRERPMWPLPVVGGHLPVVVSHDAKSWQVELAYTHATSRVPYLPERTPVFALKSGVVVAVEDTERGRRVYIDHQCGFSTEYVGLTETIVQPGTRERRFVHTGELVGYVVASVHGVHSLRFTLFEHMRRDVPGFPIAIDPRTVLSMSACRYADASFTPVVIAA